MKIIARGVGRRKEAIAQVLIVQKEKDTPKGLFIINNKLANHYIHPNLLSLITVKASLCLLDSILEKDLKNSVHANKTKSANEGENTPFVKEMSEKEDLGEASFSELQRNTTSNPDFPLAPLENLTLIVKVKGGGLIGQAEAIKLGLARALCHFFKQTVRNQMEWVSKDTLEKEVTQNEYVIDSNPLQNAERFTHEDTDSLPSPSPSPFPSLSFGRAEEIEKEFKNKGYLTQDSRIKERRKYGLKKARKASQYHKR